MKILNLKGKQSGKLIVLEYAYTKNNHKYWKCLCDCGNYTYVSSGNLTKKRRPIKSCGCAIKDINKKHYGSYTRLYGVWSSMKRRCSSKKHKSYTDYGGRGISVCDEWKNSFEAFRDWSYLNGYSSELTIDRIDNDGDYCPLNCKWSTPMEQGNNKRNNVVLTYNDETLTLKEWSLKLNIRKDTLSKRIKSGWDIDRVFTENKRKYGDK